MYIIHRCFLAFHNEISFKFCEIIELFLLVCFFFVHKTLAYLSWDLCHSVVYEGFCNGVYLRLLVQQIIFILFSHRYLCTKAC